MQLVLCFDIVYFSVDFPRKKERGDTISSFRRRTAEDKRDKIRKKPCERARTIITLPENFPVLEQTKPRHLASYIKLWSSFSHHQASAIIKLQPLSSFSHYQASAIVKLQPQSSFSHSQASATVKLQPQSSFSHSQASAIVKLRPWSNFRHVKLNQSI